MFRDTAENKNAVKKQVLRTAKKEGKLENFGMVDIAAELRRANDAKNTITQQPKGQKKSLFQAIMSPKSTAGKKSENPTIFSKLFKKNKSKPMPKKGTQPLLNKRTAPLKKTGKGDEDTPNTPANTSKPSKFSEEDKRLTKKNTAPIQATSLPPTPKDLMLSQKGKKYDQEVIDNELYETSDENFDTAEDSSSNIQASSRQQTKTRKESTTYMTNRQARNSKVMYDEIPHEYTSQQKSLKSGKLQDRKKNSKAKRTKVPIQATSLPPIPINQENISRRGSEIGEPIYDEIPEKFTNNAGRAQTPSNNKASNSKSPEPIQAIYDEVPFECTSPRHSMEEHKSAKYSSNMKSSQSEEPMYDDIIIHKANRC